jgi:hypothetical protein
LPALGLVSSSAPSPARSVSAADSEPVAEVRGVNVHAKQRVDGRDRKQLERLCRYVTRPPLAEERLERLADGRLELFLKHAWKDGTRAIVLDPDDLIVRLVARCPAVLSHAEVLRDPLESLVAASEATA